MQALTLCLVLGMVLLCGCGKKGRESLAERVAQGVIEKATEAEQGGKAKVDITKDGMSEKTKDGEVSFQAGSAAKLPDDFPKDIYVDPNGKIELAVKTAEGHAVTMQVKDVPDKIMAAYKTKFTGDGWKEETSVSAGNQTLATYTKGNRTVSLMADAIPEGGTRLILSALVSETLKLDPKRQEE